MRKEGHKPDVVTFGTLVTACEKDLDVPRAAAVWQEFKQEGVRANQVRWRQRWAWLVSGMARA